MITEHEGPPEKLDVKKQQPLIDPFAVNWLVVQNVLANTSNSLDAAIRMGQVPAADVPQARTCVTITQTLAEALAAGLNAAAAAKREAN